MPFKSYAPFPGSERRAPQGAELSGSLNPQEIVSVTIYLDRKKPLDLNFASPVAQHQRTAFDEAYGADPAHIALVEKFANEHGLTIVESSASKRRVIVSGTVAALSSAFDVQLHSYESEANGIKFRARSGELSLPKELHGPVIAVLGLDNRPQARAHIRRKKKKKKPVAPPTTFTPPQIAQIYNFPTGVTGAGQTVGIIELGGGYSPTDLSTYFSSLGITEPSVTSVAVDGGANTPGGDADGEVELDIEMVGAIANGANIAVYFAPNTDQGFIDAITDAVHDTMRQPSVISISWGGPEDSWTAQSQTAMNAALQDAAALGVTVAIAAGDNGSTDGEAGALHVDFPASSPYALACGGTTLTATNGAISSEVVWNETANNEGATGGGVSAVFALPSYQQNAGVPPLPTNQFVGRGVPDVAGNADPTTGYDILVDGSDEVVGGTSAVAPLWAALIALLNQQLGKNLGFINPALYSLGETAFNDITSGNNDDGGLGYYNAGVGWDPCTGLGSPNGAALLSALSSTTTTSGS